MCKDKFMYIKACNPSLSCNESSDKLQLTHFIVTLFPVVYYIKTVNKTIYTKIQKDSFGSNELENLSQKISKIQILSCFSKDENLS